MQLPTFLYRSERIGKNGRVFSCYKFKTLLDGVDKKSSYAQEDQYLKHGQFLRRTKLDELGQLINVLKGDMVLVGPRPELKESIHLIPKDIRKILLSVKPGLTSLSSVHFADEEKILQQGKDNAYDYHTKIKPMKILLDVFYVQHKSFLLDLAILWMTTKYVIRALFK